MSLQLIRKHFEDAVRAGVADIDPLMLVLTENQLYTEDDSETEFAVVRLQFGDMQEPALCEALEWIRGVLVVEFYTPKGQGPGKAQRLAAAVMSRLTKLPRYVNKAVPGAVAGTVSNITGPTFTPLDNRPHFFTRLSCALQASYS